MQIMHLSKLKAVSANRKAQAGVYVTRESTAAPFGVISKPLKKNIGA